MTPRPVVWSERALTAFVQSVREEAGRAPDAAHLLASRTVETVRLVARFPMSRPGRVAKTYEKPIHGVAYRLVYDVEPEVITVLAVIAEPDADQAAVSSAS
ncbi:MAG: type II toxin-antitoxin system RelE/ParE family toxin [Maricaulaceae bacterium]